MCKPLKEFCRDNGIKLTSCAQHTHQQNAVSETSVKNMKRLVRRNEVMASTGSKLRALCWTYAGHQLNRTPASTDPTGHSRSPATRWPGAPFLHARQELHPWGCLVHGFLGKRSTDPNSAPRSYPGIFVGHDDVTSGYLVYHEDKDEVCTYGYVNVFPNIFPCKERMLAGEDPATLLSGDWRRYSNYRPSDVADGPLSEFLTGKQIEAVLPRDMYPGFDGCWKAVSQRPIIKSSTKEVSMRLIFSGYTCNKSKLVAKTESASIPPTLCG